LISRKDYRRPGRKFIVRGLDEEGNAANYAETEHAIVSFQPNGSMKIANFV
jgi:hypothetical protein